MNVRHSGHSGFLYNLGPTNPAHPCSDELQDVLHHAGPRIQPRPVGHSIFHSPVGIRIERHWNTTVAVWQWLCDIPFRFRYSGCYTPNLPPYTEPSVREGRGVSMTEANGKEVLFEVTEAHLNTGLRGIPVGTCRTSFVDP